MEAIRTETKEQTTKIGAEHFGKLIRQKYFNNAQKLNFDIKSVEIIEKVNKAVSQEVNIFKLLDRLCDAKTPFFLQGIIQNEQYIMESIIQEGNNFYLTFKKGKKAKSKFMFPIYDVIRGKYQIHYATGNRDRII